MGDAFFVAKRRIIPKKEEKRGEIICICGDISTVLSLELLYNYAMQDTVYLDVLILENFCMDLWLLWLEGKLLRKKSSMRRLLAGSAAGAFGAAAGILLPGMPKIILEALLPALMQQITYGRRISLFSGCLFLLFAACLAGGFVELAGRISGFHSFFLWFPAVLFLGGLVVLFEELKREERRLCQVRLVWQNQSICLTGLLDSGNSLYTPEDHRPVYIVEKRSLQCWKNRKAEKILWIPYRSIGRDAGALPAVVMDELWINEEICRKLPVIAFSGYPVSSSGQYQILIHSQEVSI